MFISYCRRVVEALCRNTANPYTGGRAGKSAIVWVKLARAAGFLFFEEDRDKGADGAAAGAAFWAAAQPMDVQEAAA